MRCIDEKIEDSRRTAIVFVINVIDHMDYLGQ